MANAQQLQGPFVDGIEAIARAGFSVAAETQGGEGLDADSFAAEPVCAELVAGLQEGKGRPFIDVLDYGLGVDKATADKIFEPFFTARSGGTGLGLYISRELCELNRATLVYLDRPGGGSIFRIVFSDPDRWDSMDEE